MTDNLAPQHDPQSDGTLKKGVSFGAHAWGFFAGIISGYGFTQIFGGGMVGVLLAYICLLPLYLAGLSGGRKAVITAAVIATVSVLLLTMASAGTIIAAIYAFLFAMPAMVVSRVSLIKTEAGFVGSPIIMLTMLTLGAVLLLASAITLTSMNIDLAQLMSGVAQNYADVMRETSPQLSDEQLSQVVTVMSESLVGLMALSWLIIHGLNYVIAQWLAGEIGKAQRPAPAVSELALPNYMVAACIASIVAAQFVEGNLGTIFGAIAMLLGAGFTLVGLAVMHALLLDFMVKRGWSSARRNVVIVIYYVVFMGLQLPLLLALALGLIDPWLKTRRKLIKV